MPSKNIINVAADSVPSVYFIDDIKQLTVEINVTGCTQKSLTVPEENISFVNAPDGFEVSAIEKSVGSVTVVGPQSSLDNIRASDIYAVVDLSNIDTTAVSQSADAKLSVKNSNDCWVSGEYTVTVN